MQQKDQHQQRPSAGNVITAPPDACLEVYTQKWTQNWVRVSIKATLDFYNSFLTGMKDIKNL